MNYTKGGFPIWDETFDRENFTSAEIAESDLRVAQLTALVQKGQEQDVTLVQRRQEQGTA